MELRGENSKGMCEYASGRMCVRPIQQSTFTTGCAALYSAGAVGMGRCRAVERPTLCCRMHGC